MIQIEIGKPFNTEAILNFENIKTGSVSALPDSISINSENSFNLNYIMSKDDIVFGLGENVRGMNKRGGIYESFCSDEYNQTPDKRSIYAAHNLIVVDGERTFGLFIDHPGKVVFDIGYTEMSSIAISAENPNLNLFYISGDSASEIIKKFREAIGISYVPPKWAFGFQQSRWSYPDAKSISGVVDNFIKNDIPCDAIYMDIDYMERFKNFTLDSDNFPNFPEFVTDIKNRGFRLIPIIDAGCKIEDGYDVYEEGISKGYFCVGKDNKPFVGAVWPGKVHFPDFLNPDARKWFGDKYKYLIDQGIEGFWNDMNEPAIFYSEKGLQKAYDKVKEIQGENLDIHSFFDLKHTFEGISNSNEDYKSFYHKVNGELINHYDVHNMYGYNMTRAASDSFDTVDPNKRFLLFSRASSVGMHRYGGIWTGDNKSWWEHLLLNIKMIPSVNMLGFLYSGADIGGFGCDVDAELLIRWTQFGIFTPLLRNHAGLGSRLQEPYSFDKETTGILKSTIEFRYALIPYIYSEFMKATLGFEAYMKPLAFEYDDKLSRRVEDQVLVGESIMLTPIYEANAVGRTVYLPEDMLLWTVDNYNNRNLQVVQKGHSYISSELNTVPVFIKKNKILVVGNRAKNVESIDNRDISIIAYVEDVAEYDLYDDDGVSKDYLVGKHSTLSISIKKDNSGKFKVSAVKTGSVDVNSINYTIVSSSGTITGVYTLYGSGARDRFF